VSAAAVVEHCHAGIACVGIVWRSEKNGVQAGLQVK
jgi:hypothetical protein